MTSDLSLFPEQSGGREIDQRFADAYDELKRVAHARLQNEPAGHTLGTTALVHEAWARLAAQRADRSLNREQFFALAAMAMRRVLVDYARRHRASKRAGNRQRVSMEAVDALDRPLDDPTAALVMERAEALLALDAALEELRAADPRAASVVDCRYFLGMRDEDIAAALGVTARTVGRDWARARAWLRTHLREKGHDAP